MLVTFEMDVSVLMGTLHIDLLRVILIRYSDADQIQLGTMVIYIGT